MVCVIPLAQTVNRAVGCSPFRQLDCPVPIFWEQIGIGRNKNPRHLAVRDKSGLLCGKCATE